MLGPGIRELEQTRGADELLMQTYKPSSVKAAASCLN